MRALNLTLLLCILCLAPLRALPAESDPQGELDAINTAISNIQSWLSDATARQSAQQRVLREAEIELGNVRSAVARTEQALVDTRQQRANLLTEQERLDSARLQQSAALEQVLRTAYMTQDQSGLELLLNQQDSSESARMLHYYRRFSESQLESIRQFQDTLDQLQSTDRQLQDSLQALNTQQQRLEEEMQALNVANSARQQALAELAAEIGSRGSRLEQLEIDRAQLEQLITEINRAIEDMPGSGSLTPFAEQRGQLALPVSGRITNRFGSQMGSGDMQRQGIVIAAAEGSPVRAVHPGRVVFADWLRGAGLLVILDHGDGYMSLYGANQALSVGPGDWADSGDIVGLSGETGEPAQPGIYFEIRHHGQPLNPQPWLDAAN